MLPVAALLVTAVVLSACGGDDEGFSFQAATDGGAPVGGEITAGGFAAVEVFPQADFKQPVFLTAVPGDGGLLAVAEQEGRVRVFAADGDGGDAATLLDISDRVESGGEEGLIGLAFDPGFADNGSFYVHYSAADPRRSVIARFTATGEGTPGAEPETEAIIIEQEQPYSNHNGGMLAFGPDGMLYLAFGDGGSQGDPEGNAQDLSVILGKIIRIDVGASASPGVPYSIPDDNPFAGTAGARGEIWAYGFRNPYRFSFDRGTGDLWAGDVGQKSREEIDLVRRGGNYGWSFFEGSKVNRNPEGRQPGEFIAPVTEYDRSRGISVIGGYVYRGSLAPGLTGAYIFGDYGSGSVWALEYERESGAVAAVTGIAEVDSISSFGEDADGELYVVSLAGKIFRLEEK